MPKEKKRAKYYITIEAEVDANESARTLTKNLPIQIENMMTDKGWVNVSISKPERR